MKYKKIKKIAKGWSSYIWLATDEKGLTVAIKEVREKSNRKDLAQREGKYLTLANSVGVGPKIVEINFEKNFVSYVYVPGENLLKWMFSSDFEKATKEQIYDLLKEIFKQALILDSIGLRHTQLQVGKNILITKKNIKGKIKFVPTIIDFEKSSLVEKTDKNFGQVASFLLYNPRGEIAKKIRKKLNINLK